MGLLVFGDFDDIFSLVMGLPLVNEVSDLFGLFVGGSSEGVRVFF